MPRLYKEDQLPLPDSPEMAIILRECKPGNTGMSIAGSYTSPTCSKDACCTSLQLLLHDIKGFTADSTPNKEHTAPTIIALRQMQFAELKQNIA
jgi:hypothetical protein